MIRLLHTIMLLAIASTAWPQDGLQVNSLFDGRYRDNPAATETILSGPALSDYELKRYHGLTLTGTPDAADRIEPLVTRDGSTAINREVSYRSGRLYYGFYQLPQLNGLNRYLFYINQHVGKSGGNNIVIIYLEGKARRETIMKMLKN